MELEEVGAGCECVVFSHPSGKMLKTYTSRDHRDRAWARQKQACVLGFAPPTHGKRVYSHPAWTKAKKRYGYLTSIADVNLSGELVDYQAITKLGARMKEAGFVSSDLHNGNIGVYEGRPVVIDFGDLSTVNQEAPSTARKMPF